jgi:O-antigen/teichoic acid export membrane protein
VGRYLGLVADWGASQTGSRDVALHGLDAPIPALLRTRSLLSAVLTIGFTAVSLGVGQPEVAVLGVVVAAAGLSRDWIALGRHHGTRAAIPSVIRGGTLLLGAAAVGRSIAAVSAVVATASVAGLAASLLLNRTAGIRSGRPVFVRPTAPWALLVVLFAQVYISVDTLLLAAIEGLDPAGIYAAVYRTPLAITTIVGLAVAGLMPVVTTALLEGRLSPTTAHGRLGKYGWAAGAAVVMATPALVWGTLQILDDDYASGAEPLVLLLLAAAAISAQAPLSTLLLVLGHERLIAGITGLGAVVNTLGNFVMIPAFGMTGAAFATLSTELMVLVLVRVSARQRTQGSASMSATGASPR